MTFHEHVDDYFNPVESEKESCEIIDDSEIEKYIVDISTSMIQHEVTQALSVKKPLVDFVVLLLEAHRLDPNVDAVLGVLKVDSRVKRLWTIMRRYNVAIAKVQASGTWNDSWLTFEVWSSGKRYDRVHDGLALLVQDAAKELYKHAPKP